MYRGVIHISLGYQTVSKTSLLLAHHLLLSITTLPNESLPTLFRQSTFQKEGKGSLGKRARNALFRFEKFNYHFFNSDPNSLTFLHRFSRTDKVGLESQH
jgi:hypothetical protein